MGCTSAKQMSAVSNGEEGKNKAYSNGDVLSGQCPSTTQHPGFPQVLFCWVQNLKFSENCF